MKNKSGILPPNLKNKQICKTRPPIRHGGSGFNSMSGDLEGPNSVEDYSKGLVAGCHSFCLFSYFFNICTYIHSITIHSSVAIR